MLHIIYMSEYTDAETAVPLATGHHLLRGKNLTLIAARWKLLQKINPTEDGLLTQCSPIALPARQLLWRVQWPLQLAWIEHVLDVMDRMIINGACNGSRLHVTVMDDVMDQGCM